MSKLTYEATITGNTAPFKWTVEEPRGSAQPYGHRPTKSGQAQSYEDAMMAAGAAARELDKARVDRIAIRKEVVLEVEELVDTGPLDLLDIETIP